VGEGWEEECSHHASESEIHSLARASHTSVCGCSKKLRLVSMGNTMAKEACVMLNLVEEARNSTRDPIQIWRWRREMADESCVDGKESR